MVTELAPHIPVAVRLGEIEQLLRLFELRVSIPASYICIVTNNRTIMKKLKNSGISESPAVLCSPRRLKAAIFG